MPADPNFSVDLTVAHGHEPAIGPTQPQQRPPEDVMADAIRVLTEAARLTRPVLRRDDTATQAPGQSLWVDSGRREPADWAEFVSHALAGAAANMGGIEAILAGRPGSWEADSVRNLLASTVGHDEQYLLEHRTEPLVVELNVDEILVDLGAWNAYDDASSELARRYNAIGISTTTGTPGDSVTEDALTRLNPASEEQERQADEIADLEERLEQQRLQDWAAYGQALQAAVEAEAARLPGLTVPVVVRVALGTFRRGDDRDVVTCGLAERLRDTAIQVTSVPGDGQPPLVRLQLKGRPVGRAVRLE
jgi:hypothetical protein